MLAEVALVLSHLVQQTVPEATMPLQSAPSRAGRAADAGLSGLFAMGLGLLLGALSPMIGAALGVLLGSVAAGRTLRSAWQLALMGMVAAACPIAVLALRCPFDPGPMPGVDAFDAEGLAFTLFIIGAVVLVPIGGALGLVASRRGGRPSSRHLLAVRLGAVGALIAWLFVAANAATRSCS